MIKKLFDFLWRVKFNIALFISILIVVVLSFYIFLALSNFYKYKTIVDPKLELTLDRFHFFFKNELKKEWIRVTAPKPLSDDESPLKTFRITVKQKDLDSLNADLPTSGKDHYVDALMKASDSEKLYKIKLRYRGDGVYHWLFKQKSLRIKLGSNDVYNMSKKFNLVNPPTTINYRDELNYDLANKLELLSPLSKPCRVFLNGNYMGVYLYIEQVDESLLRKHRRMPGSIYYGDGSPLDNDGIAALWEDYKYWTKKSSRNAEQKNNMDDIQLFIQYINDSNNSKFHNFVETYLDKKKFFTFIAQDRVFGSHHHDYTHNHKLYFDPYKGKFEPISWDLRFWLPFKEKDLSLYPLQLRLASIPEYDAEIDKIAYKIISDNLIETITKLYNEVINRIVNDVESDINRDIASVYKQISMKHVSVPFSIKSLYDTKLGDINNLKHRIDFLKNLYNNTEVSYKIDEVADNLKRIAIVIDGNSPVNVKLSESIKDSIFYQGKILENNTLLYSSRKIIDNTQKLFAKSIYGTKTVKTFPGKYEFLIKNSVSQKEIIDNLQFINYITSNIIKANLLDKNKNLVMIKNNYLDYIKAKSKVLHGLINVNENLFFDKHTQVIIKPGTTFTMDANTSIYFYGKVTALGTKENPIRFIAKDPKKPWGLVAVQGKATTGSRFEYVEFENGSVDTHNLIHYTSPFNIHDMDWFEVRHCKIGRNFVGDDSMHIAYAKGIVDSCEFADARSDGLDIDISDVNITNNIFYNSGNDGLDIMTTTMNASNNIFIDMGDKGISVGEWSDANISDSIFIRTVIGTEVKDKSKVKAQNLVFVDSKEKAINLYNKNKRYDTGGFLTGEYIYLLGNTKVKADKRSSEKITQKFEGVLPKLQKYQWYETIENTPYKKYMDEVEVKYAQ